MPFRKAWVGDDIQIGIWLSQSPHASRFVWLSSYARRVSKK